MSELSNRRILLIDDTPSIHVDFRKILTPDAGADRRTGRDGGRAVRQRSEIQPARCSSWIRPMAARKAWAN